MERIEEYLETIYDIQKSGRVAKTKEIAERLDVKPSSVTEMLNKLSGMGYVEYQPYRGAILTKKGFEIADRIKKAYHIFRKFFEDFLGIDEKISDRLSCTLEHVADEDALEKICRIISFECEICEECESSVVSAIKALDGEYKVVSAPRAFEEVGLIPGSRLMIEKGSIVVDGIELSINKEMVKYILLKPV